jgi:hypothetical protein
MLTQIDDKQDAPPGATSLARRPFLDEHDAPLPPRGVAGGLPNQDWCVGHAPPERWDVSFTDRLMLTLRRWLSGRAAEAGPVMRTTSDRRAA